MVLLDCDGMRSYSTTVPSGRGRHRPRIAYTFLPGERHRPAQSIVDHRDARDLRPSRGQPDHGYRHGRERRVRVPHGVALDHRRHPELREAERAARGSSRTSAGRFARSGGAFCGSRSAWSSSWLRSASACSSPGSRSWSSGSGSSTAWRKAGSGWSIAVRCTSRISRDGIDAAIQRLRAHAAPTAARDQDRAFAHDEQEDPLMLTAETIDATARAAFDTHRTRTRYRPLDAALRSAPLDDAYRIQDALHRVMAAAGRGEIAGWKIALTSKAMQQMTGVDQPAAGAIFSKVVHASPARVDVTAYHHLGVEFEVAVRLGEALPASSGPWTRTSVAGKVAACLPAFELVEDGAADYKTLDAFTLIAQNTWNGGVVLGPSVTEWRRVDLEHAVTRCWVNDQPGGQGKTGDAMGHPFEAVAWLANLLNSRGRRLEPGMIVMTGSSITTKFPAPGDRVRFVIDGVGEAALEAAR